MQGDTKHITCGKLVYFTFDRNIAGAFYNKKFFNLIMVHFLWRHFFYPYKGGDHLWSMANDPCVYIRHAAGGSKSI